MVFWGASFAATKIALEQLAPPLLVFLRTAIGIIVLAIVAVWTRGSQTPLSISWMRLLTLGFIGVAFHQWLQALGLQSTSTTSTGWIIATIPIFAALLGWRFLREPLPALRLLGIGFGAVGVLVVISGGNLLRFFEGLAGQRGDSLILLSAFNWAVFTVLSKRWLFNESSVASNAKSNPPTAFPHLIRAMLLLMLMGAALMLPWVFSDQGGVAIRDLTLRTTGALMFLGIACSGLAYIFWYFALTKLEATETSALLYFEPLVTQAVAWIYLKEPLSVGIGLGGLTILLGVWMVGRRQAVPKS